MLDPGADGSRLLGRGEGPRERFPSKYKSYALAPILAALVTAGTGTGGALAIISGLFGLMAFVAVILLYIAEVKYLKRYFPSKSLRLQWFIICGAALTLFVAMTAGDVLGSLHFGNPVVNMWMVGIVVGLSVSSVILYVLSIGNLIYIATEGRSSGFRVIGVIMYGIGWIAVVAVSYFAYVLAYSSHDPSSE